MSDNLLKLTPDELDRYAPYHTWSEFTEGYDDYMLFMLYGQIMCRIPDGDTLQGQVGQQAYDRGQECAMRRRQAARRKPPGYQDNGDGTFSMDW